MIKLLLILLAMLGLGAWAVWALGGENSYALLVYKDWQLENNLLILFILIFLSYLAIWAGIKFLRMLWKMPDSIDAYSFKRRHDSATKHLNQGLIDLIECRWESAEKHLLKDVDYSETPLLNYLGAARAASQLNKFDSRDQYLKAAHSNAEDADVAILLTQADLQLNHRQTEQALATLSRLREIAPRHGYVLKLLSRLHHQLREWDKLAEILPALRKSNVLTQEQLDSLEVDTYKGLLEQAAKNQVETTLSDAWNSLPKVLRKDSRLNTVYISAVISKGEYKEAEHLLRAALNKHWDENLIALYGQLQLEDSNTLLAQCENWQHKQPNSPGLLLALARLSRNERLWGNAEEHYRRCIEVAPSVNAYSELADMLEGLGQEQRAAELYKAGIKLSMSQ